jgi:AcrR family transcriptional regulator
MRRVPPVIFQVTTTTATATPAEPTRAMRSDARRNREKLLLAAVELFAGAGEDVALEAIAERAGVGIGTLYRNFPTREALAEAAYRNEVQRLCDAAGELLCERPADLALAEWMDRFVTYVTAKRSMANMLQRVIAASDSELYADARLQMVGAITTLMGAAEAAGSIRSDVEPEDVLRVMSGIWLVADGEDWSERARRLLALLMDGLRYGAGRG